MNLKVKYFGNIAEITGVAEENISIEFGDSEEITIYLLKKYPNLKSFAFKMAVDQEIIFSNQSLKENSIIALLPPFSGG